MDFEKRLTFFFDFFKYLATVNTALIVLFTGLFDKSFHPVEDNKPIEIMFWYFAGSLVASLALMLMIMFLADEPSGWYAILVVGLFIAALGCFGAGIYHTQAVVSQQKAAWNKHYMEIEEARKEEQRWRQRFDAAPMPPAPVADPGA